MSDEIDVLRNTITQYAEQLRQLDQILLDLVHQAEAPLPVASKPLLAQLAELISKANPLIAKQGEAKARLESLESYASRYRDFGVHQKLAMQARVLSEMARSLTTRAGQFMDQYKNEPNGLINLGQRLAEQGVPRETLDGIRHTAVTAYSYGEAKRDVEKMLGELVGAVAEE